MCAIVPVYTRFSDLLNLNVSITHTEYQVPSNVA